MSDRFLGFCPSGIVGCGCIATLHFGEQGEHGMLTAAIIQGN